MGKLESWQGKIMLALLSACFTCILAFAASEVYIRLTKPYWTPDTLRARSLEYETTLFSRHAFPQMVQSKRDGTVATVINSRGYRGREFKVPKPEGLIRTVVLGGSAAFDIHASESRDWPHLVEEGLRERGYTNVEIINAATPGHATWDSLGRLYSEIWMFEPDYVIVYHAWNDIKDFKGLSPDNSLLRKHCPAGEFAGYQDRLVGNPLIYYTGPTDRLLCYSQLYVRLRSLYWKWRLGEVGLEGALRRTGDDRRIAESEHIDTYSDTYTGWGVRQYKLNLSLIADAARNIGATPIFLTQARLVTEMNTEAERERIVYHLVQLSHQELVQAFAETDEAIFDVAEMEGVKVLDLSSLNGRSDLFQDHVHTSSKGSEAIAQAVADFLVEVLDDTADAGGGAELSYTN